MLKLTQTLDRHQTNSNHSISRVVDLVIRFEADNSSQCFASLTLISTGLGTGRIGKSLRRMELND